MNRSRPLVLVVALLMAAAGCSAVAGTPVGTGPATVLPGAPTAAGSPEPGSLPTPLPSALPVTGTQEVRSEVVRLPLAEVRSISPNGDIVVSTGAAEKLPSGTVFVIDGIASRKVTGLAPGSDSTTLHTTQATLDEVFSDLDVTFDGTPDPEKAVLGPPPDVLPDGSTPLVSEDIDGTDPVPTTTTMPTRLRSPNPALATSACHPMSASVTLSSPPFTVKPALGWTSDCRGLTLNAEVTAQQAGSKASVGIEIAGQAQISKVHGRVRAGSSGSGQQVTAVINASVGVSGYAGAPDPGGYTHRLKVGWDILKSDYNLDLGGVPMVLRLGLPLILEFRFSGGGDLLKGALIAGKCAGTIVLGLLPAADESLCTMEAAQISSFLNLAPSAFVAAAGVKIGLGPGFAVNKQAVVFVGPYAALAFADGISSTGATSTGLMDCIRVDRSVQLNGGVEAQFLGVGSSNQTMIWEKKSTDYMGSRCPHS